MSENSFSSAFGGILGAFTGMLTVMGCSGAMAAGAAAFVFVAFVAVCCCFPTIVGSVQQ